MDIGWLTKPRKFLSVCVCCIWFVIVFVGLRRVLLSLFHQFPGTEPSKLVSELQALGSTAMMMITSYQYQFQNVDLPLQRVEKKPSQLGFYEEELFGLLELIGSLVEKVEQDHYVCDFGSTEIR